MALKDSLKQFGRFIGVLQPGNQSQAAMYDGYGYPPDDGGYYGGQYDAGQYDNNAGYGSAANNSYQNSNTQNGGYQNSGYSNGGYSNGSVSQADPRYGGGSPMSQSAGAQRSYYAEEEYPPSPQTSQRPMANGGQPAAQPFSLFGNNQRSKHPPNNVVPITRTEDGSIQRSSKHSEIIICVRGLEDCQEIINALLESKSVFINMEPMDDLMAQRVIDMLGGASFALRGTMAKISHRTYLLAPHTVDVVNSQMAAPAAEFRSEFSALRR